jgi:hypothetical protein
MTSRNAHRYDGLVLETRRKTAWRWVGFLWRDGVRLERFEAKCRRRWCGTHIRVLSEMPGGIRQRFFEGRVRLSLCSPAEAEVRLALPGNLSCGALALEHCKDHRMFDVARGTVSLEAAG